MRRATPIGVMDDTRRIATVHNWTQDDNLREINATGELNTNKIRYQYGNHIDSASLELSSTGAIISYEEYFPYGDTSFMAGTSQKEVKIKEYRYTGKEKDDATGLYYYGARYYASWLGRWMSADPLFRENPAVYDRPKGKDAEEQKQLDAEYSQKLYSEGLNMYCYVKGNPVRFKDPTGHKTPQETEVLDSGGKGNNSFMQHGKFIKNTNPELIAPYQWKTKPQSQLTDQWSKQGANISTDIGTSIGGGFQMLLDEIDFQKSIHQPNLDRFKALQTETDIIMNVIQNVLFERYITNNKKIITADELKNKILDTKVPQFIGGQDGWQSGLTVNENINNFSDPTLRYKATEHLSQLINSFMAGSSSLKQYHEKTSGYWGQGFNKNLKLFRLESFSYMKDKQFKRLSELQIKYHEWKAN